MQSFIMIGLTNLWKIGYITNIIKKQEMLKNGGCRFSLNSVKWPYLRLHTTDALDFWYSNRYCQHFLSYQISGRWVVCRRIFKKDEYYHGPFFLESLRLAKVNGRLPLLIVDFYSKNTVNLGHPQYILFINEKLNCGLRQVLRVLPTLKFLVFDLFLNGFIGFLPP